MTETAYYRDTIVARRGKRWIDPILLALINHHGDTEDARRDIEEFCLHDVNAGQFDILLRNLGIRQGLLAREMTLVDQWEGERIITAKITFGDNGEIWWGPNRLTIHGLTLPDTVADALVGRTVDAVVEHPYLPRDLVIARADVTTSTVDLSFQANRRIPISAKPDMF